MLNFVPHIIHQHFCCNFQPGFSTVSQACTLSFIGFLFQSSCPREGNYVKVSQIEIKREVVRPSMVFPTVILLYSVFYSHSAMQSCHMSTDGQNGSRLSPTNWLFSALFPLICATHIISQLTDTDRGVCRYGIKQLCCFVFNLADGSVQRLTSTHSRPTVGMARVGWRRAIQKWRSRVRV